ncbi:hypothetical protein HDU87_001127 [Geranomyces variabilis]|uniref:Ankyrin repeat protein n=1 Tax=Geranomyces variabilis TaxID=109894 RepID=A0AAD5XS64_9FUNG|nr:hypothetical protein HDU87_001127 [Geranomyces variabilis]
MTGDAPSPAFHTTWWVDHFRRVNNGDQNLALAAAACAAKLDAVAALAITGAVLLAARCDPGYYLAVEALIVRDDRDTLTWLLDHSIWDFEQSKAFCSDVIAEHASWEVLTLLEERGFDQIAAGYDFARIEGRVGNMKHLHELNLCANRDSLIIAVHKGPHEIVKYLLDAGCGCNNDDPFEFAALQGDLTLLDMLLDKAWEEGFDTWSMHTPMAHARRLGTTTSSN